MVPLLVWQWVTCVVPQLVLALVRLWVRQTEPQTGCWLVKQMVPKWVMHLEWMSAPSKVSWREHLSGRGWAVRLVLPWVMLWVLLKETL